MNLAPIIAYFQERAKRLNDELWRDPENVGTSNAVWETERGVEILKKLDELGVTGEEIKKFDSSDPKTKEIAEKAGYLKSGTGFGERGQLENFCFLAQGTLELGEARLRTRGEVISKSIMLPPQTVAETPHEKRKMNAEQKILVERLKEAGISTKRFLKVGKGGPAFEKGEDKAAFESFDYDSGRCLYGPEDFHLWPRWGICGGGGLVLVDKDNRTMATKLDSVLSPTFDVLSPRRKLPQSYYLIEGGEVPNKVLFLPGDKEGSGEVRSKNYYTVAPGTEIRFLDLQTGEKKTGRYTILHDRPIAKVKYTKFMEAVKPYLGSAPGQRITHAQMRQGVPSGSRHAQGIKYATFLIGVKEFDDATALHELKEWNKLCRPPMDERDLERMVTNARGYVEGKRAETPEVFLEKLKEKAFDLTKFTWGCDTRFVVFIKRVTFRGSDKVIEKNSTVELPADMIDELKETGLASENPWRCRKCDATFLEYPEEGICPKCNAGAGEKERSPMYGLRPKVFATIGNALMQNYRFATPIESISEAKLGLIHMYNQGHYTAVGTKGYVRRKVKQLVPASNPGLERLVLNHISITVSMPEDNFGIRGERVVVENGILNLNEKKLVPHDPNVYALTYLPIEYNPDSGSPTKFLQYLNFAFPNKIDIGRIQEFFGTILISRKIHKKGLMLVGPTDVGKSTFLKLIRGIFGKKNVSAESPNTLANTRWGTAKLRGKLLNATDEVTGGELKNLAILKRILDGNPIEAENKNEQTFEFEPTCEHIFGCNQTPTANRRDDAFWNRWLVVEMLVQIPPDKQIRDFDKQLLEEKEGILNWAIKGFERFKRNGYRFSDPQSWKEARDKWLNWGDSIQRFIQMCIVRSEDPELKIEANRVFDIYTVFAEDLDLDIQDQKTLTTEIKKLPYAQYSNSLRFDGRKQRGFRGIDIKLTTLTTRKINSILLTDVSYSKYSDYISSMENQRSQRIQGEEKQQKLVEIEELGEAPPKVAQYGAKIPPAEAVSKQTSILTAKSTVSDFERFFFETFGVNPFKESQIRGLFKDGATQEKAWKALEDMRERDRVILTILESGERSWRLVVKRDIDDAMAQQDKIRRVMTIIGDLEDQYGGAAPIKEIERLAELEGIKRSFVSEMIEQEKGRGHLYEPKEGMIARAVK